MMDHQLVDRIYESVLDLDAREDLVEYISSQFGDAAVYLGQSSRHRFGDGEFWTAGVDPGTWDTFSDAEQNPRSNGTLSALLNLPPRVMFDRRTFVPDELVERDPVPRAFLTDIGLYHATIGLVQVNKEVATAFWVARDRKRPIQSDEFETISIAGRHLGRAMALSIKLGRAEGRARDLETALDRMDRGIALVDKDGVILYANPVLGEMCAGGRGLARDASGLRFADLAQQRAYDAALRRVSNFPEVSAEERLNLLAETGVMEFAVTVSPTFGDMNALLAPAASAIVFVDDTRRIARSTSARRLISDFQLTEAEAAVALVAATAMTPGQIAELRGVSENTIKTQLKSVYAKMRINTLAELVRLVVALTR